MSSLKETIYARNINKLPVTNAGLVLKHVRHTAGNLFASLLDPVVALAEKLPAFSGNILEMNLNGHDTALDYSIRMNRDFDKGLTKDLDTDSLGIRPVLHKSFEDAQIENIWIEHDAPFKKAPALFFDIDCGQCFNPRRSYKAFCSIASAYGMTGNRNVLHILEKIDTLGAHVVYYGLMASRPRSPIRLTINGISPAKLITGLYELGWTGNFDAIEEAIMLFLRDDHTIVVALDVADGIQNRVGIEIFDDQPQKLAALFFAQKYIGAKQFGYLRNWEGLSNLSPRISDSLSFIHNRDIKALHTRINHFKIVVDGAKELSVKGYLYYCF